MRLRAALLLAATTLWLAGCGGGGTPATSASSTAGPLALLSKTGDDRLRRITQYGPVLGLDQSSTTGTLAWLGIPYAKPPVGELRWRAPVEPDAWTDLRPAREFGASCAQGGRMFSPSSTYGAYSLAVRDNLGKPVGSEDCLFLNIWRPAGSSAQLPVIVFIHGGSNVVGYSADPMYNGAALAAKANAVVVTLNYRLGLLGWLSLPQLKTGEATTDSGNFGTLDQIQALKFVQNNIAAFGGDPGNVTVMGESAGAVNVWALLVSPYAKGLMHKAVSMSGGLAVHSPTESEAYARNMLQALAIADGKASDPVTAQVYLATQTDAQIAAYLRSKNSDDLLRVALANETLGAAPAVLTDNVVIPWAPLSAVAAGNYNKVPMLAGNNLDEGKLFGSLVGAYKPSDYERFTMQYNFDPDAPSPYTDAAFINDTFLPVDRPGGWNDASKALTAAVFTQLTISSMNALALNQPTQAWYYRFDWANEPVPFKNVYGAVHALDLPFWFGNFGRSFFSFAFNDANRPGREQLSDAMMRTIGTFAATGQPFHPGLGTVWPNWPATLVFDATPAQASIRLE